MKYALALQRILFYNPSAAIAALEAFGSAYEVWQNRTNLREAVPEVTDHLQSLLDVDWQPYLEWAEKELQWDAEKGIKPLLYGTPEYPQRMIGCVDAPLVLFYRGNANLNAQRIVSIVGTRHITPYGQDIVKNLCCDLARLCPGVLVISGLAYGVDVCAHRQSLQNGIETVGVLAHGLHKIYPHVHRQTAVEMLKHGGLITEYTSDVDGDKMNFVRRNRIVAGISDCTIVVESAIKGGSLITAGIARDYGRDVFAFPGRINDTCSAGCNKIIANSEAALLTSAQHLMEQMMWALPETTMGENTEEELPLFPDLNDDEKCIVELLKTRGDLNASMLSVQSSQNIGKVTATLFSLEMKGIVRPLAGGNYHFIK